MNNHNFITKCIFDVNKELAPYIYETLFGYYKEQWWEKGVISILSVNRRKDLPPKGKKDFLLQYLDLLLCLIILEKNWEKIYKNKMCKESRVWIKDAIEIRNRWAHIGINDFSNEDTKYMLNTLTKLVNEINPEKGTRLFEELKKENFLLSKMIAPIDDRMLKSIIIKKGIKNAYFIEMENDRIILKELTHINPAPLTLLTIGYKAIRTAVADTPFHFHLKLKLSEINGRKITFKSDSADMLKFIKQTDLVSINGNEITLDFNYFPQLYSNPTGEIINYYIKENKLWLEIGNL